MASYGNTWQDSGHESPMSMATSHGDISYPQSSYVQFLLPSSIGTPGPARSGWASWEDPDPRRTSFPPLRIPRSPSTHPAVRSVPLKPHCDEHFGVRSPIVNQDFRWIVCIGIHWQLEMMGWKWAVNLATKGKCSSRKLNGTKVQVREKSRPILGKTVHTA